MRLRLTLGQRTLINISKQKDENFLSDSLPQEGNAPALVHASDVFRFGEIGHKNMQLPSR
jgi:hypothetical protein